MLPMRSTTPSQKGNVAVLVLSIVPLRPLLRHPAHPLSILCACACACGLTGVRSRFLCARVWCVWAQVSPADGYLTERGERRHERDDQEP